MSIGLDCFVEVKKNGKWEKHEPEIELFSYEAIVIFTGRKNEQHFAPTLSEEIMNRGYPKDSDYLNEILPTGHPEGCWWSETTRLAELKDSGSGYYFNISFVTLKELLDFDYDQEFEDRYNMNYKLGDNVRLLPVGQGIKTTMREWLDEHFFKTIDYLKTVGDPEDVRVIYHLS